MSIIHASPFPDVAIPDVAITEIGGETTLVPMDLMTRFMDIPVPE